MKMSQTGERRCTNKEKRESTRVTEKGQTSKRETRREGYSRRKSIKAAMLNVKSRFCNSSDLSSC